MRTFPSASWRHQYKNSIVLEFFFAHILSKKPVFFHHQLAYNTTHQVKIFAW